MIPRNSMLLLLLLFMSMGWDCLWLRPPTGLLFIAQVIYEYGEPWWNDIHRGHRRTRTGTCPSATFSTTNPTWNDPVANPGLRGGSPATNRLSHGTSLNSMFGMQDNNDYAAVLIFSDMQTTGDFLRHSQPGEYMEVVRFTFRPL
jgi:hypothetical protein